MLPRITIVVPSFAAEVTIERTLASLVSQNYPNLEIICVDGASPDNTMSVIQRYEHQIARIICEEDRCQAEALNKGFRVASGEIYGWLCADDELAPGTMDAVGRYFAEHPDTDVFTGGCQRVFDDGSTVETSPEEGYVSDLFIKNTIEQPSTFWRSQVHLNAGELDETLKYAFDWEYWCRFRRLSMRFERTDQPLSVYYFSDSNLTSSGGSAIAKEMYKIVKEYGPYKGWLARVYMMLYRIFDLRGFYDGDVNKGRLQTKVFHICLRVLYVMFDRHSIDTYNWNFAARQERGKGW